MKETRKIWPTELAKQGHLVSQRLKKQVLDRDESVHGPVSSHFD